MITLNNTATRRAFLAAIARLTAVAAIPACSSAAMQRRSLDLETLAGIAYDLFPYEALGAHLYVKTAENMVALESPVIRDGLNMLAETTGNRPWAEIPERERIDILESMEHSEFFSVVRITTIETLYREPELWALIGYGGSAVEHGGYVGRGFDDISWLPTVETGL